MGAGDFAGFTAAYAVSLRFLYLSNGRCPDYVAGNSHATVDYRYHPAIAGALYGQILEASTKTLRIGVILIPITK